VVWFFVILRSTNQIKVKGEKLCHDLNEKHRERQIRWTYCSRRGAQGGYIQIDLLYVLDEAPANTTFVINTFRPNFVCGFNVDSIQRRLSAENFNQIIEGVRGILLQCKKT